MTTKRDGAVVLAQLDRDLSSWAGVFLGVLQALQAAEVDRDLQRVGMAPETVVVDADRDRGAGGGRLQHGTQAFLADERRDGTVRGAAELVDGQIDLGGEPPQRRAVLFIGELLAREREADAQRDQALQTSWTTRASPGDRATATLVLLATAAPRGDRQALAFDGR